MIRVVGWVFFVVLALMIAIHIASQRGGSELPVPPPGYGYCSNDTEIYFCQDDDRYRGIRQSRLPVY